MRPNPNKTPDLKDVVLAAKAMAEDWHNVALCDALMDAVTRAEMNHTKDDVQAAIRTGQCRICCGSGERVSISSAGPVFAGHWMAYNPCECRR